MSTIQIKKIKVAGSPIYPATIIDAVKDATAKITVNGAEQDNPNYGKTIREILASDKATLNASIDAVSDKIGDLTNLSTEAKGTVVAALNELKTALGSVATDDTVQGNTKAIALLNGDDTQEGSVKYAVAQLKSALVGDATADGDTLGELEDRLEKIEKLITDGTDGDSATLIDNLTEVLNWFANVKETETGAALVTDVAANKAAIGDEKSGLVKKVADLEAVGATKVTVSATEGVTDAAGVTYKYVLPTEVVKDASYSHITVSAASVTDAAGNTFKTALSVKNGSDNYLEASNSEVGVKVATITAAATGLVSAKSVYDYALTAEDSSDKTDYADVF